MAQIKIYPATKEQANTIINKIDAIDAKIVTPNYQDKTVTPSDVQQIVQADNGYNALHSVTVEPIAAAMPENLEAFIMNTAQEPYSLSLNGVVPAYACHNKSYLKRVYGNLTSVSDYSFSGCSSLESVDVTNLAFIGRSAFQNCSALESFDAPNLTTFGNANSHTFGNCTSLKSVDLRGLTAVGTNGDNNFTNCTSLQYVDLRKLTSFGTNQSIFNGCTSLSLIDFTLVSSVITLNNTNHFINTNNDWIAVVANDTVKAAFQSATNWSAYASHFRTIAEVEAGVGMTYDEYYLQCFGHPRFD